MTQIDNTPATTSGTSSNTASAVDLERLVSALGGRSIVLVGIMGCGKSTVGKRLAQRLGLEFIDADSEIERAANMTVSEIFATHGEPYFRSGEERVIARLLREGPYVLATGGGAFMSDATRAEIFELGLSIWLKVDFETVMARVRRRSTRPLLQNPDPEGTMRNLLAEREPVYAQAALTVKSTDVPHDTVVDQIVITLADHLSGQDDAPTL